MYDQSHVRNLQESLKELMYIPGAEIPRLYVIDQKEKDGGCTFYQDALRSGIMSKSRLESVEGQT